MGPPQTYTRHLLRTSYREGKKVRKETIANISHCSPEEVVAIKLALRHKNNLSELGSLTQDVEVQQGTSFGATYILNKVASRLGIDKILGNSQDGKLALWQIIARIMNQGSRLSATRLADYYNATSIIGMDSFNEDHLYRNLDWLADNQEEIERKFFNHRHKNKTEYFLYDITSSYLEGNKNELANWGYNRDKKNGKMQIVIGLLCDKLGLPISIEVFDGSTSDCKTVGAQMDKIAKKWDCESITLIGDKGMIQGPQIDEIEKENHSFITTIAKSRIEPLVVEAGYQTTLIDENLLEIISGEYRYILRRNPVQAEKTSLKRELLLAVLKNNFTSENEYLSEHPKATIEKAVERMIKKINKFKMKEMVSISVDSIGRILSMNIDQNIYAEKKNLDGCYAMKTNISADILSNEEVQKKYKGLAKVEDAFRCSKTEFLEMRPIHVRLEKRTRGHVFVVMLGYHIVKELERCWKSLDLTAEEAVELLKGFQTVNLTVKGKSVTQKIPRPNAITKKLYNLLNIDIPNSIPASEENVVTRKKLGKGRV